MSNPVTLISTLRTNMDYAKKLQQLTGIKNWVIIDGPDTQCGVDYYFKSGKHEAYINNDQGSINISVDGEHIFSGME